jgi:signal transduction histidine kinase
MVMVKISEIMVPIYNAALPVCERRGLKLNLDLPDPTIKVDAGVKKILQSLLKAAMKRTKEGAITMGARREGDKVEVWVRDSGEALTRKECEDMADEMTEVRSRYGYGTTVTVVV